MHYPPEQMLPPVPAPPVDVADHVRATAAGWREIQRDCLPVVRHLPFRLPAAAPPRLCAGWAALAAPAHTPARDAGRLLARERQQGQHNARHSAGAALSPLHLLRLLPPDGGRG